MCKSNEFGDLADNVRKVSFRMANKAGKVIQKTGNSSATGMGFGFFLGGTGHVLRTTSAVFKGARDVASLLSVSQFAGEVGKHGNDWTGPCGALGGFAGLCNGLAEVCNNLDENLEGVRKKIKGD